MKAYQQGLAFQKKGRYKAAIPFFQKALKLGLKEFGPNHQTTAALISNYALPYYYQGRYSIAEPLFKRSLAIREKALGPDHLGIVRALNDLARLYNAQGRYNDAEPLFKRALVIFEKSLGPMHPNVATGLNNLAWLYKVQEKESEALEYYRRTTAIRRDRATRTGERSVGPLSKQKSKRGAFTSHVAVAIAVAGKEPSQRLSLTAETFSVSQLALATRTSVAVSRMAARFAASNDDLAKTIRDQQDAIDLWQKLDMNLIKTILAPPNKRKQVGEKALREQVSNLDSRIEALSKKLATEFPSYQELAGANPVSLSDV